MKKIISFVIAFLMMTSSTFAYPISVVKPSATKGQVVAFLEDRNASKEMIDMVDFIYDYSKEIGLDPVIIIAMSCIETGYGKSNLFVTSNNPGGIKSRNGWRKFNTLEEGYGYMIRLVGTYGGLCNEGSWLHASALRTEDMHVYWGYAPNYHNVLTNIIENIKRYKDDSSVISEDKGIDIINNILDNSSSPRDIINNILNRNKNTKTNPLKDYIKKGDD